MLFQVRVTHPFSGLREGQVLIIDEKTYQAYRKYLQVLQMADDPVVPEEKPKRKRRSANGQGGDQQDEG